MFGVCSRQTPPVIRCSSPSLELMREVETRPPIAINFHAPRPLAGLGGAFLQLETSGGGCQMAIEVTALTGPADFTAEVRDEKTVRR